MKYKATDYAHAYIESKPETKDFLRVVQKHGDMVRIAKIVEEIEKLVTKQAGGKMVHVEFAREQKNPFTFDKKDHVRTSINPSLVAGVRITLDGSQEFDNSFQRKVNTLWHTI